MSFDDVLLSVRDLTVDYVGAHDVVRAVDNVNFEVKKGEAFGIAGESGCGKSTLAFALARLTRLPGVVTGGSVYYGGEDVLSFTGERLRKYRWNEVSFVFQSAMNALNPVITISEQMMDVVITHTGCTPAVARARAAEMLELVGIHADRLDDFPHQFSGGMRQRIGIAIALILSPGLIIMDEPTTALDVVVQRDIIEQIYELKNRLGFSVVFITHDLGLMMEFCDRVAVMYSGEIVELAPAKDILVSPRHPYTKALGSSFPPLTGPKKRLEGISGTPPHLSQLPMGCRFAPRCAQRFAKCNEVHPALQVWPDEKREAACHLN